MTSGVARLYVLVLSVLGFFLAWAGIAAQPWRTPAPEPAPDAVAEVERRLLADADLVARVVARRSERPAAPVVRVVTLPPVTRTRTS